MKNAFVVLMVAVVANFAHAGPTSSPTELTSGSKPQQMTELQAQLQAQGEASLQRALKSAPGLTEASCSFSTNKGGASHANTPSASASYFSQSDFHCTGVVSPDGTVTARLTSFRSAVPSTTSGKGFAEAVLVENGYKGSPRFEAKCHCAAN